MTWAALLLMTGVLASPRVPGAVRLLPSHSAQASSPASAAALDYDVFKTRVQPIFLNKRKGLARCYVCHSQGTAFRLQALSPGSTSWNEEQSRRNFEIATRFAVPGKPLASRLLTMPLVAEAGGISFHPGGKHWSSQDDPEWQAVAAWIRGER